MDILENDNIIVTVPDYLDGVTSDNDEIAQNSLEESPSDNINQPEPIDYTDILESIDDRLTTLEETEIPDYSQTLQDISDNSFRLYYFVGGLYVAFAILIGIKFFKIFF